MKNFRFFFLLIKFISHSGYYIPFGQLAPTSLFHKIYLFDSGLIFNPSNFVPIKNLFQENFLYYFIQYLPQLKSDTQEVQEICTIIQACSLQMKFNCLPVVISVEHMMYMLLQPSIYSVSKIPGCYRLFSLNLHSQCISLKDRQEESTFQNNACVYMDHRYLRR